MESVYLRRFKKYICIFLFFFVHNSCIKVNVENNNDPFYIFKTVWTEIDRNYSYFNTTKINWDSVYLSYRPFVKANMTEDSLFRLLSQMIDLLKDAHTNIYSQKGVGGNINYFNAYPLNEIELNDSLFDFVETKRIFKFGILKNKNSGYLKIKTFDGFANQFLQIDSILLLFQSVKGLIVDVRTNFGGEIGNSQLIASRFIDSERTAARYRVKNGIDHNDFNNWINFNLVPFQKGNYYKSNILILTNRRTYSAAEWFVMFACTNSTIKCVGDTTGGGAGIPMTKELPNGWILRITNTQTKTIKGIDFQKIGLAPDYPVWITKTDVLTGTDAILEKAIDILNQK